MEGGGGVHVVLLVHSGSFAILLNVASQKNWL